MMREAGFTLVELLAAMLAGAFLLAVLAWNVAALGREVRADVDYDPADAVAAIAPQLSTLIEAALPPGAGDEPPVLQSDKLSIVTTAPMALGPVGPMRLTLSVNRDSTGEALSARVELLDEELSLPETARAEQKLLSGMDRIDFDYVDPDSGTAGLPRLVRLIVDTGRGEPIAIAAAPRVNTGGACHFDLISMACRP